MSCDFACDSKNLLLNVVAQSGGGLFGLKSILGGDKEKLQAAEDIHANAGTKADVLIKVLGLQTCKDMRICESSKPKMCHNQERKCSPKRKFLGRISGGHQGSFAQI